MLDPVKYRTITIIIAVIFIINIIVTSLVVSSILGIETPDITVNIDVVQVTDSSIIVESAISISNPNAFSTELSNFKLTTTTDSGYKIGEMNIPDTTLPSKDTINITSDTTYSLNNENINNIKSLISGNIQVDFLGIIKKDLPISVNIITNPSPLIDAIALPQISANIDTYDFTNYGLLINGSLEIKNINDIGFSLEDLTIGFSDSNNSDFGSININPTSVPPHDSITQPIQGNISYDIFNKGTLRIHLAGNAGLTIAGYAAMLPFNTTTSLSIPDLKQFLLYNENLSITLFADADFTLTGMDAEIGVIYNNPMNIPLTSYNLTMRVYRIHENYKTLIAEDTQEKQEYPPRSETILSSNFSMTYIELIPDFSKGPTQWIELYLYSEFTIGKTNQRIPVTIRGLLSPQMFGVD